MNIPRRPAASSRQHLELTSPTHNRAAPRLRVALLCHASLGGSTRVALDLANALARQHEVHLCTLRPLASSHRVGAGVQLHVALPGTAPAGDSKLHTDWSDEEQAAMATLLDALNQRRRLDIVHFHYARPFAAVVQALRERNGGKEPTLVGTLHGTDSSAIEEGSAAARELRAALSGVILTTVSDAHAALSQARIGLAEPPLVIPNFIDTRRYRPALGGPGPASDSPATARKRPLRVVHVSNFRPIKNLPLIAEAFIALARQHAAELWLVGDGEALAATREQLESDPASRGAVAYMGVRSDLPQVLQQTDIALLGSHHESFSLAALEAMACGVPVVAPAVGGLPEVVWHGYTGRLFAPGDVHDAARQLLMLARQPGLLARYARTSEARAARYDTRCVTVRYEKLYRDALAGKTRPAPAWAHRLGLALPSGHRARRLVSNWLTTELRFDG